MKVDANYVESGSSSDEGDRRRSGKKRGMKASIVEIYGGGEVRVGMTRGRKPKMQKIDGSLGDDGVELRRTSANESSRLDSSDVVGEVKQSLMCHQCQRNDKGVVVNCLSCKRKRYCFPCLMNWFFGKTEEIEEECPVCCGNCNCKACLRSNIAVHQLKEAVPHVRLKKLRYLLHGILPLLKHIHSEQVSEREIEANIQGVQRSDLIIEWPKLDKDERRFCSCGMGDWDATVRDCKKLNLCSL